MIANPALIKKPDDKKAKAKKDDLKDEPEPLQEIEIPDEILTIEDKILRK